MGVCGVIFPAGEEPRNQKKGLPLCLGMCQQPALIQKELSLARQREMGSCSSFKIDLAFI